MLNLSELKAKMLIREDHANHCVDGACIADVAAVAALAVFLALLGTDRWRVVLLVAGCAAVCAAIAAGLVVDLIDRREGRVFSPQDVAWTSLGGLLVGFPLLVPWIVNNL